MEQASDLGAPPGFPSLDSDRRIRYTFALAGRGILGLSVASADGEAGVTLGVEGAMKTKCECGREFEAPAGAASAKCPRCGRAVKVEQAADWLAGVDLDGLSLGRGEGPEKAQEPAAAQAPTPTAPRPGTKPAAGGAQKSRAGEGAGPVRPSAGQGASRVGTRSAAPSEPVVLGPPPSDLLALGRLLKDNPKGAIPHLRVGIESRSFVVQLGATFLGLALVAAIVRTWSVAPRDFAVGAAAKRWMTLLIEMAASGVLFSLVAVLLKREAKPLGVCQALAVVRTAALLVVIAVSVVMGVLILLTQGPKGSIPEFVFWLCAHASWAYFLVILTGQMFFVMKLLALGCWPTAIGNIVATYAAYTMAERVTGAF